MSAISWLQNSGFIGRNTASTLSNEGWSGFDTPYGDNAIATPTLTKGQKTFSTNETNPNIPKPKTLFFVYFHLNPKLEEKIQYKHQLIEELSGTKWNIDSTSTSLKGPMSLLRDQMSNGLKYLTGKLGSKSKEEPVNQMTDSTLVDYIPSRDIFLKLSYEMSKLVRQYDKPNITFDSTTLNEYNRKRIVYDGIKYDPVTISFFDVKDNVVQQFFISYLKFICGDFLCKNKTLWEAPVRNNQWQNRDGYTTVDRKKIGGTYLGNLNTFGLNIDSNFRLIDSISFCEYYMNKIMVYTIENPVIKSVKFGNGELGDFSSNDITVSFEYEGITNDLIGIEPYNVEDWNKGSGNNPSYLRVMVNKEIKADVATFLQTRYKTLSNDIASDITNILKGYMNGTTKFSWNTIKNQALDTARKYSFANEANTYAQLENTIKNFNSKDGTDKWKYLINIATDPTSIIGRASASTNTERGYTNSSIIL